MNDVAFALTLWLDRKPIIICREGGTGGRPGFSGVIGLAGDYDAPVGSLERAAGGSLAKVYCPIGKKATSLS